MKTHDKIKAELSNIIIEYTNYKEYNKIILILSIYFKISSIEGYSISDCKYWNYIYTTDNAVHARSHFDDTSKRLITIKQLLEY